MSVTVELEAGGGKRPLMATLRRLDDKRVVCSLRDAPREDDEPRRPVAGDQALDELLRHCGDALGNRPLSELPAALSATLATLGRLTGADRIYLFSLRGDSGILAERASWQRKPGPGPLAGASLRLTDLPWIRHRLQSGEPVVIHDLAYLPTRAREERELMLAEGIRALALVPLRHSGLLRGFLAMDLLAPAPPWSSQNLQLLQVAGSIISMAMLRQHNGRTLHRLAYFDGLTGLPNRDYLRQQMDSRLLANQPRPFALALLDLDDAGMLNDMLDHEAWDALIHTLAIRCQRLLPKETILARWGADEFMLLLPLSPTLSSPEAVVEQALEALAEPIQLAGQALRPTFCTGMARFPADADTTAELLRYVELALRDARRHGRASIRHFRPRLEADAVARGRLQQQLQQAVDNQALQLQYQPLVHTANGKLAGAEALLRWHDPELGEIAPDEFVAMAERTGLIQRLGEWVLEQACTDLARWRNEGIDVPKVAVNVSGHQLLDDRLPATITRLLSEHDLPAGALELEITESTLMERGELGLGVLQRLRRMGISLAVDDFGTGYSSLGKLKHLPVNVLKIDHAFIKDIFRDESDRAIVIAVLTMARRLRLQIVAEGVETASQLAFLRSHRCDVTQGFIHGGAMKAETFTAWVRAHKA